MKIPCKFLPNVLENETWLDGHILAFVPVDPGEPVEREFEIEKGKTIKVKVHGNSVLAVIQISDVLTAVPLTDVRVKE